MSDIRIMLYIQMGYDINNTIIYNLKSTCLLLFLLKIIQTLYYPRS